MFFFPWVLSAPRRQEYPLRERDPTRDVGPSGGSIGGMVYKNFCDQEREKHIKTKHSLAADHQEPWNEVATRRMKMPVFRSVCLCRTWYPCVSQPSRASDHVCCCCCCSCRDIPSRKSFRCASAPAGFYLTDPDPDRNNVPSSSALDEPWQGPLNPKTYAVHNDHAHKWPVDPAKGTAQRFYSRSNLMDYQLKQIEDT